MAVRILHAIKKRPLLAMTAGATILGAGYAARPRPTDKPLKGTKKKGVRGLTPLQARLVERNMNLVHHAANRAYRPGMSREDMIQAGHLGLIKSAMGYKKSKGTQFSTYAYPKIQVEMDRGGKQKGYLVRVPERKLRQLYEQGGLPEIVHSPEDMIRGTSPDVSGRASARVDLARMWRRLGKMKPDRRAVLLARYGKDPGKEGFVPIRTHMETARLLGKSTTRVHQLEKVAFKEMRG